MKPFPSKHYIGVVAQDPEIKPLEVGGTWYPSKPAPGKEGRAEVVLHFHGGAFVIGDGRNADTGFLAKTFLETTPATHVFCTQYRLSSNPGGRFPAALQDAITSLLYLTETMGIPAKNITVSGDSAGGNLTLALLRYISTYPNASLPSPGCAWLWSPWVDPAGAGDFDQSPHFSTDYLTKGFGLWGLRAYAPSPSSGLSITDPYIRFLGTAFKTPTPLFFSAGESEILFHDDVKCFEEFKEMGNKVELQVERNAVHDVILVGNVVGMTGTAREASRRAGVFLTGCK